jgi:hypothetical protein
MDYFLDNVCWNKVVKSNIFRMSKIQVKIDAIWKQSCNSHTVAKPLARMLDPFLT